ncbi:hypothetical protein F442_03309 [Phytophthora nicotianae P10297]|uniref:NADP-dependent oxidoreductase domain-containing protein n=3 Tax=Phytophthora nicotianae TaxID=4792 RepID=W2ZX21_PHYNI|nr:hypothetical protein L915_03212 [Phytophthora nicotianae]ETM00134.1 hypothetical protein L917_03115 [Phytophthora nicotianae]ETM53314.1 hypothetical protein L914_03200 [Phytophthora nicotianae]ETP51580.1 hypothetical protein F442_03309 [Phytophthora nicotianae P10297]
MMYYIYSTSPVSRRGLHWRSVFLRVSTAGKPDDSRFKTSKFSSGPYSAGFEGRVKMADKLKPIAEKLGCSLPQMSVAWAVSNANVSMVLAGASSPSQLEENLKELTFVDKITPEVKEKIDAIVDFVPSVPEARSGVVASCSFAISE